jgi:MFS family permease
VLTIAVGPFIGGIIVTYQPWRVIFWLQTALAGVATLMTVFFQPETIHSMRSEKLQGLPRRERVHTMWEWLNPMRIVRLYRYPNLLTVVSS